MLKRSLFMLAVILCCISFSAFSCDAPLVTASADPPPGLTPRDSSASSLSVDITINEDQDSTDRMSVITMRFMTQAIEEANYAIFDDREPITCSGRNFTLGSSPTYTFLVPQGGYVCSYTGNTNDGKDWLPPVTIFNVAQRSELSLQAPIVTSKGYSVAYRPDAGDAACAITGVAMDNNGGNIPGPTSLSDLSTYNGPPTGSLSGDGSILLTRTCHWQFEDAFHEVGLTYKSSASVEVTWTH